MSWAIWITGVPGSGKSVLARAAASALQAEGEPVRVLELDEIRKTLTPAATYSDAERDVVYRALVYLAALLVDVGIPVIIDATAHRREWRDLARATLPRFAEVQLVCPLEVCQQREQTRPAGHAPRGIYAHAGQPGATVPGVDVPYEPALAPELVIDTAGETVAEAARRIVTMARRLAVATPSAVPRRSDGWAVWITGRPGSGKTALAERVAQALTAREVRVKVLDLGSARRLLLPEGAAPESLQEVAHRAIGYAAKLLTDAGVAVIIDATAPRRAWREAARELIPCFAEVQLVCPPEICVERERAARWSLGGRPREQAVPSAAAPPDIVLDYEEALRPELLVATHVHDLWTAAEQVLFLTQRLRRVANVHLEQP